MKYVSIDIESTGLNVKKASALMISMIFVDTSDASPKSSAGKLTFFIKRNLKRLKWDARALEMNQWILETLRGEREAKYPIIPIQKVMQTIEKALIENGYKKNKEGKYDVTFAGANLATFDIPLLMNDIRGFSDLIHSNRRVMDPAILFVDYNEDDALPGLSKTLERAGMDSEVLHDAQSDAMQIVDLLELHRNSMRPMFPLMMFLGRIWTSVFKG